MDAIDHLDDTICAIATPIGVGGVGIIRLSGRGALDIAKRVCPAVSVWTPRYMVVADVCMDGDVLDRGCVVYFKGPSSYTGEDTVEFQLHSNPIVLRRVLEALVAFGARLAVAGEFTRRAFFNGRMDLSYAESVGELIHASSDMARQLAIGRLKGRLYRLVSQMRVKLMSILEQIEGSVDFPEEVPSFERGALVETLSGCVGELERVLSIQDYGKRIFSGVKCVIMGRPNVGKSSLMNALVGENRSIVTSVAGTTRDFIDVSVELGGVLFQFVDTAGIRGGSQDVIEKLGMKKVRQLVRDSDLILWVVDGSRPLTSDDLKVVEGIPKSRTVVTVVNKGDKRRATLQLPVFKAGRVIHLSAKTLEGIHEFKTYLRDWALEGVHRSELDLICNVRQVSVLRSVKDSLVHLLSQAVVGLEDDVLSIDLKQAVVKLGEFTGEEVTEEMLDGVFSRFCVGK